jgi:hypothetical protein
MAGGTIGVLKPKFRLHSSRMGQGIYENFRAIGAPKNARLPAFW